MQNGYLSMHNGYLPNVLAGTLFWFEQPRHWRAVQSLLLVVGRASLP